MDGGKIKNLKYSSMTNRQEEKFIFALVGLPARGKSYLSRKLANYMNWIGYSSKVYSIGLYRRSLIGVNCNWKFFEDKDEVIIQKRQKCLYKTLDDLISFLTCKDGKIGILDGANTSKEKRRMIENYIKDRLPDNIKYNILWIESICTEEKIIEENLMKTKLKSPDYKGWDEDEAIRDFLIRIKTYENTYDYLSEELDGSDCSFIQMINYNAEVNVRNVKGFVESKVLSFLMNLFSGEKPIYFTRHGESEYNQNSTIGGDSALTEKGRAFSKALYNFLMNEEFMKNKTFSIKPVVFTSTLKRCLQTAEPLTSFAKQEVYKCLDDIDSGEYDGMPLSEFKEKHAKEYDDRIKDKLNYRYPRGESYMDLINRIEPIIYELERREGPVIVIGNQATLRCLYGYFTNTPLKDIPHIHIPDHTIIRKLPQAYGFNEERFKFDPDSNEITKIHNENYKNFEDNLYNNPDKEGFNYN
jgi:6-phosphofructo-2-kinase/fructose-2,6-biphosphatase 2